MLSALPLQALRRVSGCCPTETTPKALPYGLRGVADPLRIGLFTATALMILLGILGGCGGRLATNGCAMVTGVACDGSMRLQYKDGTAAIKRLDCDNMPKDLKVVAKNQFQPARFVETSKGSTLTFPNGDTVTYKDVRKDPPTE